MATRLAWERFVARHGIAMSCEREDENPEAAPGVPDGEGFPDHYRCAIRRDGRRMTIHASMRAGIPITLAMELGALSATASEVERAAWDFGGWARWLKGADREMERPVFALAASRTDAVRRVLGPATYREFLRMSDTGWRD